MFLYSCMNVDSYARRGREKVKEWKKDTAPIVRPKSEQDINIGQGEGLTK